MKNASRTLSIVGIVINSILALLLIIGIILFGIAAFNKDVLNQIAQDSAKTVDYVKNICTFLFVSSIIQLVVQILVLLVAIRAVKSLGRNESDVPANVVLVVAGVIGFDLFYLLGGIFGIAASKEMN